MRHHNTLLAVAAVTTMVLAGGCTKDKPAASPPPKPSAAAGPQITLPATPPAYTMPANLCTAVSGDAFTDLVPEAIPKTSEMARSQTVRSSSSTCIITLGTLGKAILVSIGADIYTQTYGAQGNYESFREVIFKDYPGAKDLNTVGTAAYFYDDPALGPHLVVWFGNAHLTISAIAMGSSKQLPADTETRLVSTAKATLSKLPTA